MTTDERKETITYGNLVSHLLGLRKEVLETSPEEAKAIDRLVSELVALEVYGEYTAEFSSPGLRN